MLEQQAISSQKLQQRVGQKLQVLVESSDRQGYLGRSYADAPEIDGLVHIETDSELVPGEYCDVEIDAADEYDLYATPSR